VRKVGLRRDALFVDEAAKAVASFQVAWVATRDPDPDLLAKGGDPGIIARFEIPIE
jgi:hypothetical protein